MTEYAETEYVTVWLSDSAGHPTFVYETKEKVVRCKDCDYRDCCDHRASNLNGFCAWGERITANGGDGEAVE